MALWLDSDLLFLILGFDWTQLSSSAPGSVAEVTHDTVFSWELGKKTVFHPSGSFFTWALTSL